MRLFEQYEMIGGEVHYGRIQPQYWGPVLDAAGKIGVRVIATYVMWHYHEVQEGEYDFTQLHKFLKEVEAETLFFPPE